MMDSLATISRNRQACTGVGIVLEAPLRMDPQVDSEEGFSTLVSEYYLFFRETLALDISFLRRVEQHLVISEFDRSIYLLRTAQQHRDNADASRFMRGWLDSHPGWQGAADALAELLKRALEQLARVSSKVRRDASLAAAWRDRTAADPASILESVSADLAVNFSGGVKAALLRNVERRAKQIRPGQDVRMALEALCAEEITNRNKRLPVPYFAILDRLGLLGHPSARAALLLAYSIGASASLKDEAFLVRVEQAWKVVSQPGCTDPVAVIWGE